MTSHADDTPSADAERDLVEALLESLEASFDLRFGVEGRPLGHRIEERLQALGDRETPTWGTSGDPAEVSSEESPFLRFVYHPHLFPGMEPELRLAHELQFDLLPTRLPEGFPLAVSAVLESYCHLSGDLLGWRSTPSGAALLWLIDVSGHGVRSGLASAVIKVLLDHAPEELGLAGLLDWLHRTFRASRNRADQSPLYATGIFLEVDSEDPLRPIRFASAGHQPILLRPADDDLVALGSTAPPLALLDAVEFREADLPLEPRDILLLYTDGVVETESMEGEAFGRRRLQRLLREAGSSLTELTGTVHRAVVEHNRGRGFDDDLTFLAVKRVPLTTRRSPARP